MADLKQHGDGQGLLAIRAKLDVGFPLSLSEVAIVTGRAVGTLRNWRCYGRGPLEWVQPVAGGRVYATARSVLAMIGGEPATSATVGTSVGGGRIIAYHRRGASEEANR